MMNSPSFFCVVLAVTYTGVWSQVLQPRMLGGAPAEKGSLPSVVSVKQYHNNVLGRSCLGSIIDNQWILTSALCVLGGDAENTVVEFGRYIHSRDLEKSFINASEIITHPDFNSKTGKHDIALIKLLKPINTKSGSMELVRLGQLKNEKGAKVRAVGWNENPEEGLSHGIPEPFHLGILDLDVLEIEKCKSDFPELNKEVDFDGTQICAYDGVGKDLCSPDFGGPLFDQDTGEQVGIFNDVIFSASDHSHQCHPDHDHPLLFTKVEAYLAWISDETGINLAAGSRHY